MSEKKTSGATGMQQWYKGLKRDMHSVKSMFVKTVPRSQIYGEETENVSNVGCLVLVVYLKMRFEPSVSSLIYLRLLKSK